VAKVIATFGRRRNYPRAEQDEHVSLMRSVNADSATLVRRISRLGAAEKKMLGNILKMFPQNPAAGPHIMGALFQYAQVRYMYEQGHFWEPMLSAAAAPVVPLRPLERVAVPA
jgi:hypothetical protein